MKHFKDPATNEVYAYEADGSQDDFIRENLVAITDAQADAIRDAHTQAEITAAISAQSSIDAPTKLAQFLASNPDVMALVNGS